jgi:hypothetical protein
MTGPEHYREAERLLSVLAGNDRGKFPGEASMEAEAQIHATLALAAAAALAAVTPLTPRETYPAEVRAWRDATGVPDGPPRG